MGRAGTRMYVVAAAEELVSGAERPMDEEDAAAPVGGDRGRGPGGLRSPRTPRQGSWARALGSGAGPCALFYRLPWRVPSVTRNLVQGLTRTGGVTVTGWGYVVSESGLSDQTHPTRGGVKAGPVRLPFTGAMVMGFRAVRRP